MAKEIFKDMSKAERLEMLSANAEKSELFTYHKSLNEDEMSAVMRDIVRNNIELARLQEEREAFNEDFKFRKKPIDLELKVNLQIAHTNTREVEEKVYLLANQESGIMEYYNAEGNCVYERPLLQEERQFRIAGRGRTGTEDY